MTKRDLLMVIAGVVLLLVLQAIDAASLARSATTSRPSTDALVFQPMSGVPRVSIVPVPSVSASNAGSTPSPSVVALVGRRPTPSLSPSQAARSGASTTASTPKDRQTTPSLGVTGTASWFAAPTGTAAAGPALRAFLGVNWRGTEITVTANGHSVRVAVTDWCACPSRVIDLGADSFARLAPLSRGIVTVTVAR